MIEQLNYRDLLHKVIILLTNPAKAWQEIDERREGRMVLPLFVYPLIGLCGLSEFIGTFIGRDMEKELFQIALTRCCAVAVSLFGGFFLATYLLKRINRRWYGGVSENRIEEFVGYSMVVTLVLNIVGGLFPIEVLLWIVQLYTIFIVFEGARRLMKTNDTKIVSYTIVATCLVLLSPAVIEYVFNKLSLILN